jgi:hypothetical protein
MDMDTELIKAKDQAKEAGFPGFMLHCNYGVNFQTGLWFAGFYREYHLSWGDAGCVKGTGKTPCEAISIALGKLPTPSPEPSPAPAEDS